jgi:hypothetical protein
MIANKSGDLYFAETMNKKFQKLLKGLLALGTAALLPSCIQDETTITLNKDGSGTIVTETILGAQMIGMMSQFSQPGQPDPMEEMFSEEKAKERAATMGEGVEFVKAEKIDKDGKRGGRFHYKFADINKIAISPTGSLDGMSDQAPPGAAEEEEEKDEPLKFEYKDGKLTIISPPANFDDMTTPDGEEDNPQMEAMMEQMLGDMRLSMNLIIADGIKETNASHVDGNKITLFDAEVGKILSQKDKMKEIEELGKEDPEAAKKAMSGIDGMKFQSEETVTVTVK